MESAKDGQTKKKTNNHNIKNLGDELAEEVLAAAAAEGSAQETSSLPAA